MVLFGGGVCGFFGYNEIQSMSGRYASYWNAFLFYRMFLGNFPLPKQLTRPLCVRLRIVMIIPFVEFSVLNAYS